MDAAPGSNSIDTALALSRTAHEAVDLVGLPDLAAQWRSCVDAGAVSEGLAARLIAVGAVHPSKGLLWLVASRPELAQSADQLVRVVVDDEELAGHGLVLTGTLAETLGRGEDVPEDAARALVALLDAARP